MGIRLIIVGMVENEQGYEDFTDTSVHNSPHCPKITYALLDLNRNVKIAEEP